MSTSVWLLYQPVIVGLGAVVVGTLGNTLLEWFRAHLKNKHSAEALRRALVEELRQAHDGALTNAERCENVERGGSLIVPVNDSYPIYQSSISQLGILKPSQVGAVVRAYGMLQAKVEVLSVLGAFQKNDAGILHCIVGSDWGNALAASNRDLAKALKTAIDELSPPPNGAWWTRQGDSGVI